MGVVIIDLMGDEEDVRHDDEPEPEAKKPCANDLIRYTPQLEIVPVEPSQPRIDPGFPPL